MAVSSRVSDVLDRLGHHSASNLPSRLSRNSVCVVCEYILPALQAQNNKGRSIRRSGLTCTLLKTGRPRWVLPPFLGFTPPTIWVPYAMACMHTQLSVIGSRHCMKWCRLRSRSKIPLSSVSCLVSHHWGISISASNTSGRDLLVCPLRKVRWG